MPIDTIGSGVAVGVKKTISAKETSKKEVNSNFDVDEKKSNASKYMIGATALAAVVCLGIAGYNGKLGKGIQKFLGKTEKDVNTKTAKEKLERENTALKEELEKYKNKEAEAEAKARAEAEAYSRRIEAEAKAKAEAEAKAKARAEAEAKAKAEAEAKAKAEAEAEAKAEAEAEAKAKAEAEAEAKVKAEENAFIEKHKKALTDKLFGEGNNLWDTTHEKYNKLVVKFSEIRTKFAQIKGQKSENKGMHIIEQKFGKDSKNAETTMTYYSKDGNTIDKIVCTRNGEQAYQVTYRDHGQTVELNTKDIKIDGRNNGIVQVISSKDNVRLSVYNSNGLYKVYRNEKCSDGTRQLGIQYSLSSPENMSINTDRKSLCAYLNIND